MTQGRNCNRDEVNDQLNRYCNAAELGNRRFALARVRFRRSQQYEAIYFSSALTGKRLATSVEYESPPPHLTAAFSKTVNECIALLLIQEIVMYNNDVVCRLSRRKRC
ncbi:hypothetical protein EVAR_66318_1 [Eumeta japonica]|uniref:Uncharacterized protein n=1 Tax=Eumeta variegata TaxID=151549 RepID=A0A4C1ZWD3_EUMVA|nr:hypothetical protein EVAR_66318_1 [Eumeta japonica]